MYISIVSITGKWDENQVKCVYQRQTFDEGVERRLSMNYAQVNEIRSFRCRGDVVRTYVYFIRGRSLPRVACHSRRRELRQFKTFTQVYSTFENSTGI